MDTRAKVEGPGPAFVWLFGSGTVEGRSVHTFLALASSPARSTRTAIRVREAECETSAARCARALLLAALPKTALSTG